MPWGCPVIASSVRSKNLAVNFTQSSLRAHTWCRHVKLTFTGYSVCQWGCTWRERAEEFVDPGVCRCREPADWSLDSCHHFQKRLFAATGKQKEGFISQHVSIFLQQRVRFLERCVLACVSATEFSCLFSAAYFQLCHLVVDMEDGGREREHSRQYPPVSVILLNSWLTRFQQNNKYVFRSGAQLILDFWGRCQYKFKVVKSNLKHRFVGHYSDTYRNMHEHIIFARIFQILFQNSWSKMYALHNEDRIFYS